jgi:DNA-binding winged helix-turn-helix (wHTH) protein/tetratricopeptide (TPR) repeat protein
MPVYAFGPFLLSPGERRLTRSGRPVAVPGKAWRILALLAEAGGRLVSHETFRAKLWPDVLVEDRTLTVHVSTLRKALGDGSTLIETVPREGYRLTAPVRVLSNDDPTPSATGGMPSVEPRTLTVPPFATGGMAQADSYLGVGMAEAVTTVLGRVPGLTVYPVGAVDGLASANDRREAGRALGVGHVLEGSVQLKDEQLHISAHLVDVASGRRQWTEHFEKPRAEAAALQDVIAQRVADSLAQLSPADRSSLQSYRPRSTEAFFLQLEARANLKLYVQLPLMKAVGLFEQALALDPDYALAHAGLAWTYLLLGSTTLGRSLSADEAGSLARRSADRALALDEGLGEAWAVLGRVKMEYDWDWDGAEADLAHAVALNPSSVEALAAYGQYLSAMGRHDEAIEITSQAYQLDPRRAETLHHFWLVYWMAGDNQRALAITDEALVLAPQVIRNLYGRAVLLDYLGRHEEAMASRLDFLKVYPVAQSLGDELVELSRAKGWRSAMLAWLAMLERTNRWETAAIQWMAIEEPQRALDALEHCVSQKSTYLRFAAQCPAWRPLHGEPRFQKILRTLKLSGDTAPAERDRSPAPDGWPPGSAAGG